MKIRAPKAAKKTTRTITNYRERDLIVEHIMSAGVSVDVTGTDTVKATLSAAQWAALAKRFPRAVIAA